MSNYVPRFCKKQETLERKEHELIERLIEGVAKIVVFKSADEVRLARIRALREKLAKLPPVEGSKASEFHRLEKRIRIASQSTVNEIVDEFKQLASKEVRQRTLNAAKKQP